MRKLIIILAVLIAITVPALAIPWHPDLLFGPCHLSETYLDCISSVLDQ